MDREDIRAQLPNVLRATDLGGLGERRKGKVRDIYLQEDKLILVSTDRHSSFDRIIAHVPFKGQVLNQTSAFWFGKTKDIIQNHALSYPDPNVLVARRCTPLPIEMVVRGYITGVTGTSLWTLYNEGKRDFGDFLLPDGMQKNQRLHMPVLTPTTKSDEHDRPVTSKEAVTEGLVTEQEWETIAESSLALFARGQEIAASRGLILVDTKYEFGKSDTGEIVLIDEIHTPDSSRWWKLKTYGERFSAGAEPEYFDKEFLRLWFIDHSDPYNDKELPEAPEELVVELSARYIELYEQLTGEAFTSDTSLPVEERIRRNLDSYHVA